MRHETCDSITMFCGCYRSKSSATRAMRGWVGDQIKASWDGISNRFETTIVLREDMMEVTRLQGGWGVAISYTIEDLLCVIRGEDGSPKDVTYAQVAHWQDASHPPQSADRPQEVCTIDVTPTWGEWSNIFYRFAISGERKIVESLHPDMALAFSAAEAFKIIQRILPAELSAQAEAVLRAEMAKQGCPISVQEPEVTRP